MLDPGSNKADTFLIRGARQVVTLHGPNRMRAGSELNQAGVLQDASILVQGGIITQVGSTRRLENLRAAAGVRRIDARHLIVLPAIATVADNLLPDGSAGAKNMEPVEPGPGTASRRWTRELSKLALAGLTYVQFSTPYPEDVADQSRVMRSLLRVEAPSSGFSAALRLSEKLTQELSVHDVAIADVFPASTRMYYAELRPQLRLQLTGDALRSVDAKLRFQLLRRCVRELGCQVRDASALATRELLALGVAAPFVAYGFLPSNDADLARIARWALPWTIPVGEALVNHDARIGRLPMAVSAGVSLSLAVGYDVNRFGIASPLALISMLHQQSRLSVPQILQLTIPNMAFALGVGDRMGTLSAGKEANLLLIECEHYSDLGTHVGAARLVGVYRRGLPLTGLTLGLR